MRFEFDGITAETFAFDAQRRTMTGVVVPWGKIGRHSSGRKWRFERGSLKFGHAKYVRLNEEHVQSARIGRAFHAEDTPEGLLMTFRLYDGPQGDRALALAVDGQKTGFSVEIEFDELEDSGPDPENPGVVLVSMAHLTDVAFVKDPAFTDARLRSVRASRDGGPMETCEHCGAPLTEGVVHTCPAPPSTTETALVPAGAVQFSADQFDVFMQRLGPPSDQQLETRPTIDPTAGGRPAAAQVTREPLPYRFSYEGPRTVFAGDAEHDFSTDLFAAMEAQRSGRPVGDAMTRINHFVRAAFADVEAADVTAINPNQHRPDMWVPQREYRTVLWDMVAAGTTNGTKFDIPKFTSASGLVGPATEKTEPAGGSFVAELQTITPTQVWGKVEVTRQAWRAGGNPALSGILWDQMLREYYEDREAAVATFLATLTAAADITLPNTPATSPDNDDDQATAAALEAAIAMLQFDRGGDQISAFAAHRDLYKLLARVKDDAGRPMYPMINPMNANGTAASRFKTMNVAGVTTVGSYALGASGVASTNSWLFDPAVVRGWASAPERMFWDFGATVQTANIPQLSFVTVGIYGDIAFGNTDITGVRQVVYDPSQD